MTCPDVAQSQDPPTTFSYQNAPLRSVLEDVERRTAYRFLYRDALVAGVRISLVADSSTVLSHLRDALSGTGLRMERDHAQQQVLLAPEEPPAQQFTVTGYVVDATSGARVPRATVVWQDPEGTRQGDVADQDGRIRLQLASVPSADSLVLTASHVGYHPTRVTIDPEHPPAEVAFRLQPRATSGPSVTVRTTPSALDTTWRGFTQPDLFTPLGEPSVIRTLQLLPSVSVTDALSGGLHVRGSPGDAFHVKVNGMPIYNQSHLFGLFDAFNAEALQTVGVFPDVAPVRYWAPPGGTLALQSRPGSQSALGASASLSSTAVSGTVDGPLLDGRASWLLSARRSYLNTVQWPPTTDLLVQGLGLAPRTESLPDGDLPIGAQESDAPRPSARFFDTHATAAYESDGGHRLTVSAYAGGDRIQQAVAEGVQERTLDDVSPMQSLPPPDDESVLSPTKTTYQWGNEATSVEWEAPWTNTFTHTTLALSRYHAHFRRERGPALPALPGRRTLRNELIDGHLQQSIEGPVGKGTWTAGYMARWIGTQYRDQFGTELSYQHRHRSVQADLFGQYTGRMDEWLHLRLGLRAHGVSSGRYGRLSPRLWTRLRPAPPVSVTLSYTRNHQFLHRLTAARDPGVNVWIPSGAERPPSTADQGTLGLTWQLRPDWWIRGEGYYKQQQRVRLHEALLPAPPSGGAGIADPGAGVPWVTGTLSSRGIELLHRLNGTGWRWTTSYSLSRTTVALDGSSPRVRPARWDRRHQGTTRLLLQIGSLWTAHVTWLASTGRYNTLHELLPDEPSRLALYHRLDAAIQYRRSVGGATVSVRATVLNLYDHDNPRYRRPVSILESTPPRPQEEGREPILPAPETRFTATDIYDLGIHPSFDLTVTW